MQIDERIGTEEEVHTQDTIDLEAVVHPTDFNFKRGQSSVTYSHSFNLACENNLYSTHATHSDQRVLWLWQQPHLGHLIRCELRLSRPSIHQHMRNLNVPSLVNQIDSDERQAMLQRKTHCFSVCPPNVAP